MIVVPKVKLRQNSTLYIWSGNLREKPKFFCKKKMPLQNKPASFLGQQPGIKG